MDDVLKKEELLEKINDALLLVRNDIESGNKKKCKYEVGAAVINEEGAMLEKEILDDNERHGMIFREFARVFGVMTNSYDTYEVGVECAHMGLIAEQVTWEHVSFYLPSNITVEQLDKVIEEIVNRPTYVFEIYHNGKILDDYSDGYDLLNYLSDYIENSLDSELSSRAV